MTKKHQLKHLQWFVSGSLVEYFKATGMKVDTPEFDNYYHDTVEKAIRYIKGTQVADASFSDAQCGIVMEARKLFGDGSTFNF